MRTVRFQDFELDLRTYDLRERGEKVDMGGRAIDTLVYLIDRRDRIVSKEELRTEVWNGAALSSATIPTTILEIRRALGDSAETQRFIKNVRARGYQFVCDVDAERSFMGDAAREQLQFAGRKAELESLLQSASDVRRFGSGRVVAIQGEAGIGKTRLLTELLSRTAGDLRAVVSRCSLIDGVPPFWPWTQALESAVGLAAGAPAFLERSRQLANVHPEVLGTVQPSGREAVPLDRFSLFNLWIAAFRDLAAAAPLIIAFEDAHLADLDSLDLLSCLAEEIEEVPLLLIVTHRPPTYSDKRADRLAEIRGIENSRTIQLGPLSTEDVVSMLGPRDARTIALGGSLCERAKGIPFYITHLVRNLDREEDESNSSKTESARALSGREIVSRQLSDLPEGVRSTLATASLIGDRFPASLLAQITKRSVSDIADELTVATRSSLLGQDLTEYEFSHSLLRESLSSTLDPHLKRRLHLSIATELQRHSHAHSRTAQIADHLAEAIPLGDGSVASRFARLAGQEADSRFAYAKASKYLERSLDLFPDDGAIADRCELMRELARASLYAGDRSASRELLLESVDLARAANDSVALALSALQLAPEFLSIEVGINDATHIRLLEESLEALDPDEFSLRAQVIAHLAQALQWTRDPERLERLAIKSMEEAATSKDREALIAALSARAESLHGPARAHERLHYIERLGEVANVVGDQTTVLLKHTRAIAAHLELGDIPAVERENDRYRSISSKIDLPQYRWYPLAHDSTLAMLRGEIKRGECLAEEFRSLAGDSPDQNCLQTFAAHFALRRVEEDRCVEALPLIEACAEEQVWMYHWRIAVPWFYVQCDQIERARSYANRFNSCDLQLMACEPGGGQALAMASEVFAALGKTDMCEQLLNILEPIKARCSTIGYGVGYFGSLARYAGLAAQALGMTESAISLLSFAATDERERGAPSWYAYAEADLCGSLLAAGATANSCIARLDEVDRALEGRALPRAARKVSEARDAIRASRFA
ncbi:MAG: hypothetical protein CL931_09095 [Deltaproteobacteria bacterium]|nr:hypothetical protein [Deltaproteobacteria bacterium]